jgi:hypothetical protein
VHLVDLKEQRDDQGGGRHQHDHKRDDKQGAPAPEVHHGHGVTGGDAHRERNRQGDEGVNGRVAQPQQDGVALETG